MQVLDQDLRIEDKRAARAYGPQHVSDAKTEYQLAVATLNRLTEKQIFEATVAQYSR